MTPQYISKTFKMTGFKFQHKICIRNIRFFPCKASIKANLAQTQTHTCILYITTQ